MFKILSSLIWFVLIFIPLVWFINNNGWISIVWLGHEVKIDILTFILASILLSGILLLTYRIFSSIISLILGIFGIFCPSELKKREKIIKKYGSAIDAITQYVKAINTSELRIAKSEQRRIYSLLKDQELDYALSEQLNQAWKRKTAETGETDSFFSPLISFFRKIFK